MTCIEIIFFSYRSKMVVGISELATPRDAATALVHKTARRLLEVARAALGLVASVVTVVVEVADGRLWHTLRLHFRRLLVPSLRLAAKLALAHIRRGCCGHVRGWWCTRRHFGQLVVVAGTHTLGGERRVVDGNRATTLLVRALDDDLEELGVAAYGRHIAALDHNVHSLPEVAERLEALEHEPLVAVEFGAHEHAQLALDALHVDEHAQLTQYSNDKYQYNLL